jgi:hypothetical protein
MDQLIEKVEEEVNKLEQELELRLTELKMLKTKRDEQRETNSTLQEV